MSSSNFNFSNVAQGDLDGISIFDSIDWYKCYQEHVCFSDEDVSFKVDFKDGFFVAPFVRKDEKLLGFFRLNVMVSMSNYYTPLYEFLSSKNFLYLDANLKADKVLSDSDNLIKSYDKIKLSPLESKFSRALVEFLSEKGFSCFESYETTNWLNSVECKDSFWSERSGRLKNTIKRKRAKLDRISGYKFKIYTEFNSKVLLDVLAEYHNVYYKSWKIQEASPAFIDAICRVAKRRGELRIGVAYYKDDAIAAQIWFVRERKAYIFKLAYDPEFRSDSVGTILMADMFNYVIEEDKVRLIDFLTGNDNYKKDWMNSKRELKCITCYNRHTAKGWLGIAREKLSRFKNRLIYIPSLFFNQGKGNPS